MKRKLSGVLLSLVMALALLPASAMAAGSEPYAGLSWANPFSDVSEDDWFFGDVEYVCANGLFEGAGETAFEPRAVTTRAMLAAALYRLEGEPTIMFIRAPDKVFSDVEDGAWYEKAVQWAQLNGIVDGYEDGTFRPGDAVTREQLVTVLYRYAIGKGLDVHGAMGMAGYEDAGSVSAYAASAMQWACAAGLVEGDGGRLRPQDAAERCQVAAILHRFCELVK